MSLFQFGLRRVPQGQDSRVGNNPVRHMPTAAESGLASVEFNQVCEAVFELTDPSPARKRRACGKYTHYTPAQRAQIGWYALENGNERARKNFASEFPDLKESTIRNCKKAYKDKLDHQRKQLCPQPVTEIPHKPRGRPPILMELNEK